MRVFLVLLALFVGFVTIGLTQLGATKPAEKLSTNLSKLVPIEASVGLSHGLVSLAFETPYYLLDKSQKAQIDHGASSYVTLLAAKVSGDATAYTAYYSSDANTYTRGNTLGFVPVADIPSPVVNQAESADVYLSNEVDFPSNITNQLGIVVWQKTYQLVRVNRYDSDTHAANLTLGVAGSAIKGFNLQDDNTAKLYLINDSHLIANVMLENAATMHVKAVPEFNGAAGDVDAVIALQVKGSRSAQRPPPIAGLLFQASGGEFDEFPDTLSYTGSMKWQFRAKAESKLVSFNDPAAVADAGLKTRVRIFNNVDEAPFYTVDVDGTAYDYSNKVAYQYSNYQDLTFVFTAVMHAGQKDAEVESEPVFHRIKRDITPLLTNNLQLMTNRVGADGVVTITYFVEKQSGTSYTKGFTLSGDAVDMVDWGETTVLATDPSNHPIAGAALIFDGRKLPYEINIPANTQTITFNFKLSGATVGHTLRFETPTNGGPKSVTATI